jgi:hypothetical protein
MAQAASKTTTERHPKRGTVQHWRDLEGVVCDVENMSQLCTMALENAENNDVLFGKCDGLPESEYIKITRKNWSTLNFALNQQEDLVKALVESFYAGELESKTAA